MCEKIRLEKSLWFSSPSSSPKNLFTFPLQLCSVAVVAVNDALNCNLIVVYILNKSRRRILLKMDFQKSDAFCLGMVLILIGVSWRSWILPSRNHSQEIISPSLLRKMQNFKLQNGDFV